jgi:hypothetical protein
MISRVNRILFRRSGTLNMFFKLESIGAAPEMLPKTYLAGTI